MTIEDAMKERHKVSKFTSKPLSKEVIEKLNKRIEEDNKKYDLSMELITNNTEGLPKIIGALMAKGVNNYVILAGKDKDNVDERLGYCSSDVMLYAQTLGLNTWWIGGMYSRKGTKKNLTAREDVKIVGILAVGYGENQGVQHKCKSYEEVCKYDGDAPEWFKNGVNAALLAPTAMNKQGFFIEGKGNKVTMTCNNGSYSNIDLGICKHHFELGAGKENFEWS